jgi:hypothetical protein
MLSKLSLSSLGLSLLFGILIFIPYSYSSCFAQTATQSDSGGSILSTGDFAGQTFSVTTPQSQFEGGSNFQGLVNQSALTINTELSNNSLTTLAGSSISVTTQQSLSNILTGNEQSSVSINSVAESFSATPGSPPLTLIQDLLSNLEGLTKNKEVSSAKLLAAVRAYNAMILASEQEFLGNPPAEILAIQAILTKLTSPAAT